LLGILTMMLPNVQTVNRVRNAQEVE
jgi:hypothetical protein